MTAVTVLVATWRDGLFALRNGERVQELAHHAVCGLAPDGAGGALAIVDSQSLRRRAADGTWNTVATADVALACSVAVGDEIYVGTDDARVLRVASSGGFEPLRGFDRVADRAAWYAGQALVDGRLLGPPLGVRSITATADGGALLANVHVGGIPRSTDGGRTWQPTIDLDYDVHEVRAHPRSPNVVIAAAAIGLCASQDAGATWRVATRGLHASYCSAVAFAGDDALVAASVDHFAPQGALYRRTSDPPERLEKVSGGLPEWLDGIADTGCVAARDRVVAVSDRHGTVHWSRDTGRSFTLLAAGLPTPSSVLVI